MRRLLRAWMLGCVLMAAGAGGLPRGSVASEGGAGSGAEVGGGAARSEERVGRVAGSGAEVGRGGFPRPRHAAGIEVGSDAAIAVYAGARAQLENRRKELARRLRDATSAGGRARVVATARDELERGLVALVGPWFGTPWDFYGTSEEPGRGQIACGYFVTTVLRDAGLRIERVRLAQVPSELLVRSVAPARRIWRFRNGDPGAVLNRVLTRPARWFVVGLDYHVGLLLRLDGGEVLLCHASYLPPGHMLCEDARTSPAMQSGYHVVGALFTDELVRKWLRGEQVRTVR